jgi:hypothetical protein
MGPVERMVRRQVCDDGALHVEGLFMEILDWLARAGGIIALLLATLGFMFKEKWKQLLQRSLAEDLERLKSELSKSQAEHAASLMPQLEQMKHDFQQRLEAYKVSLISEAEGAKARADLKKSIALRFAEIEFDRLIELEALVIPMASGLMGSAGLRPESKSTDDVHEWMPKLQDFNEATDRVGVLLPADDWQELLALRTIFVEVLQRYIGSGKPKGTIQDELIVRMMKVTRSVQGKLGSRIKGLAQM